MSSASNFFVKLCEHLLILKLSIEIKFISGFVYDKRDSNYVSSTVFEIVKGQFQKYLASGNDYVMKIIFFLFL